MNTSNANKKTAGRKRSNKEAPPTLMSDRDLAALGGGRIAYIKIMSSDEARRMYPAVRLASTSMRCRRPTARRSR
jgi:hypothetical protein